MRYESLRRVEREATEVALAEGDVATLVAGINYRASYDEDWRWVLGLLMRSIDHPSAEVRSAAARGVGTLVRLHADVPVDDVVRVLRERLADDQIAPYVQDALEDIEVLRHARGADPRLELVDAVRKIAQGEVGDLVMTLTPLGPELEQELSSPGSGVVRNEREAAALASLIAALDAVLDHAPGTASDAEIMRDPGWENVVDAARSALAQLGPR